MKKPSPNQANLLRLMVEGWRLRQYNRKPPKGPYFRIHATQTSIFVTPATVASLLDNRWIEVLEGDHYQSFQLTDEGRAVAAPSTPIKTLEFIDGKPVEVPL